MPNQANRSKDQSNIVKPKKKATKASTPNPNQAPSKKSGDSSEGTRKSSGKSSNAG